MKKALIIEIGGSHQECLYSQLLFLKDTYTITICCSHNLVNQISSWNVADNIRSIEVNNSWKAAFDLRKQIKNGQYDVVVFNTAHGKTIRNLFLLPKLKNQNYVGIVHNLKRYKTSRSQKIISKSISKYFVLSRYLLNKAKDVKKGNHNFGYFYAMFFPPVSLNTLVKPKDEIWVCIPGQIEQKRRDYNSLIEQIEKFGLSPNIKLIFLGRANQTEGKWLIDKIHTIGIANQCKIWEDYINEEDFSAHLKLTDYFLPLIHNNIEEHETYLNNQISGTFNLAFGYHKPILLENTFANLLDFKHDSIAYKKEDLVGNLNKLETTHANNFNKTPFDLSAQQDLYLTMISK